MLALFISIGVSFTAQADDSNGSKSVIVKSSGIDITKRKIYIKKGTSVTVEVSTNSVSNSKLVRLKSAKKNIVSVKRNKLKAKKTGTAKISVTVTDENKSKIKTYVTVKVVKKLPKNTINGTYKNSESVKDKSNQNPNMKDANSKDHSDKNQTNSNSSDINSNDTATTDKYKENRIEMAVGDRIVLQEIVKNQIKQGSKITWSCVMTKIARISDGVLIGVGPGCAIISATTDKNQVYYYKVNVSDDWLLCKNLFCISAHRGAVVNAPENTIEAVKEAIRLNYDAIEIDPRISADGEVFLMHDLTVDRTTNGTGSVDQLTSDEIDALLINTKDYPAIEEEIHVARFEEAVRLIADSKLILNVDASKMDYSNPQIAKKVVGILKKYNMTQRTFFVISDERIRNAFNRMYPELCVSWLYNKNNDITQEIEKLKKYKHAMLSVHTSYVTKEIMDALNKAGVYYQIYSVDSEEDTKRYQQMKVPMIETNTVVPTPKSN